ncbi:TcpQ domain-containing protein [Pseudoduganella chitinolytica]|uniref:TcpQ domain-containing protein n=1 Tax=Pseudoduganella chitinolytica TaxID=34070 RepID=A0ABY8B9Y1_9BURK|nr:TcpQ domain-containing protein [Pseudoduganella chitinolytica]WEF32243.1 TcpQ domain-containing protein [Pseudoduganella chitinolytica]
MYLTTASPGPFAGRFTARLGACLLLALAAAAPLPASAVNSLLPREEPAAAPAAKAKSAPKARQNARRGKSAVEQATVVTTNAPPAVPPLVPPAPIPAAGGERWDIVVADRTLNAAMARWAAAAGWQLLWELPVDYAVQAHTTVPGKFEEAVAVVVNSMEGAEIPMKAVFYSGNKVLRIMAKGAQ